ncbi:hypothetical protein R4P64_33265 [Rhodococcus sp. IEGM 1366]|uniref:hypothetical protein n=1 Tax=Rhodococcus sp. IEGM 1366 TaxID=3082223 RepID=UPI0029533BE8|nr:hypothetical protein [Rhodococcus sp. IEGM 1366]MDV8071384.1 hypothetical protein [Rhodococcus sp. IEGM 1366]
MPLAPELETMGIADPTRIMLELGQAGGPTPTQVMPVTGLLGRELASADECCLGAFRGDSACVVVDGVDGRCLAVAA